MPEPGNPQALNRYAYVLNNPLRYNDPSGHCPWCIGAAIGAIVGAVVGAATAAVPQMIQNVRDGQPLTANIDPGEVGKAAVAGFVAGAVGGATFGLGTMALGTGLTGTVASGAISGVAAGQAGRAASNVAAGQNVFSGLGDPKEMAVDALIGGGMAGAGYGFQRLLAGMKSGGALPLEAESWQEAEELVRKYLRLPKNTTKFFVEGMSRPQIPDIVSDEAIYEVKWYGASKLTSSPQLRDMAVLAKARGVPFNIVVRQGTYVTDSVYDLVESTGGRVLRWLK